MVIHYQKPILELETNNDHLWEKSVVDKSDFPNENKTII